MPLKVLLPSLILILAFTFKLFIDRKPTIPNFVEAILELPVSVAFLAISFVAAFCISAVSHEGPGILYFVAYVVGTVAVIVAWRRSESLFYETKYVRTALVAIPGYALCVLGLVQALHLIVEAP